MLLASTDAVTTITLLHDLFLNSPSDRVLAQSVLLERLELGMDDLRAQGYELNQTPQGYVAYWRTKGWLSRSLAVGAVEEEYSLTAEACNAVRMVLSLLKPRSFATESRLASVMHQVIRLDEDTDANPATRLAALESEKTRIEEEISQLSRGELRTLTDERALERAREIIQQANELTDDFQNVRSSFERLNQDLRASLLEAEGSRNEALGTFFKGLDVIKQSDAGRTFDAFWRLLTDIEQSSALAESLEHLLDRRFAGSLTQDERRFLQGLPTRLMAEANSVQSVVYTLDVSLNRFVRNDTLSASKRINDVLQKARLAALELKDAVDSRAMVPFSLTQSVPQIRSVAQYQLRDPQLTAPAAPIAQAQASSMELSTIQSLISQSEINLKELKANVREALSRAEAVSILDLLEQFPVEQGFGTVVGYITLGTKHGTVSTETQLVRWTGKDAVTRAAELPKIYFTQDNLASLHD